MLNSFSISLRFSLKIIVPDFDEFEKITFLEEATSIDVSSIIDNNSILLSSSIFFLKSSQFFKNSCFDSLLASAKALLIRIACKFNKSVEFSGSDSIFSFSSEF